MRIDRKTNGLDWVPGYVDKHQLKFYNENINLY